MLSRHNRFLEKVACKSMLCVYNILCSHKRVRVCMHHDVMYCKHYYFDKNHSISNMITRVNMIMQVEYRPCEQSINVE